MAIVDKDQENERRAKLGLPPLPEEVPALQEIADAETITADSQKLEKNIKNVKDDLQSQLDIIKNELTAIKVKVQKSRADKSSSDNFLPDQYRKYTIARKTTVKGGPSETSDDLTTLDAGAEVVAFNEKNGWIKIDKDQEAYVSKDDLKPKRIGILQALRQAEASTEVDIFKSVRNFLNRDITKDLADTIGDIPLVGKVFNKYRAIRRSDAELWKRKDDVHITPEEEIEASKETASRVISDDDVVSKLVDISKIIQDLKEIIKLQSSEQPDADPEEPKTDFSVFDDDKPKEKKSNDEVNGLVRGIVDKFKSVVGALAGLAKSIGSMILKGLALALPGVAKAIMAAIPALVKAAISITKSGASAAVAALSTAAGAATAGLVIPLAIAASDEHKVAMQNLINKELKGPDKATLLYHIQSGAVKWEQVPEKIAEIKKANPKDYPVAEPVNNQRISELGIPKSDAVQESTPPPITASGIDPTIDLSDVSFSANTSGFGIKTSPSISLNIVQPSEKVSASNESSKKIEQQWNEFRDRKFKSVIAQSKSFIDSSVSTNNVQTAPTPRSIPNPRSVNADLTSQCRF